MSCPSPAMVTFQYEIKKSRVGRKTSNKQTWGLFKEKKFNSPVDHFSIPLNLGNLKNKRIKSVIFQTADELFGFIRLVLQVLH